MCESRRDPCGTPSSLAPLCLVLSFTLKILSTYTNGTCPKLAYKCSCIAKDTAGKYARPDPCVTLSNATPIDTPFLKFITWMRLRKLRVYRHYR